MKIIRFKRMGMSMINTFNQYEEVVSGTAIYPEAGLGSMMALSYVALGLGEAGEVQGKVKKYIRDGVFEKREVMKELGDVLWYVTAMAKELGYSLQDVAEINAVKLLSRKERGVISGSGDNR
jgi:NTP pyrophosphatase (non-canonical NTP hydrolase)